MSSGEKKDHQRRGYSLGIECVRIRSVHKSTERLFRKVQRGMFFRSFFLFRLVRERATQTHNHNNSA